MAEEQVMKECEHTFTGLRTIKTTEDDGYNKAYILVDWFYCTKCLERKSWRRKVSLNEWLQV